MTMISHCDVKNSAQQIQMTSIRHWIVISRWKFLA